MSSQTINKKLADLIDLGRNLVVSLWLIDGKPLGKGVPKERVEKAKKLIFRSSYDSFYTNSIILLKTLLPERLDEFCAYYHKKRAPSLKSIGPDYYGIKEYLDGITFSSVEVPAHQLAGQILMRQLDILLSARDLLDARIREIASGIEYKIIDAESDVARELANSGHVRAAGAVLGVAMEVVLKSALVRRGVPMKKEKNNTIADLNDALKAAGLIAQEDWRRIQVFADLRNKCVHAKEVDPSRADIEEMRSALAITQMKVI